MERERGTHSQCPEEGEVSLVIDASKKGKCIKQNIYAKTEQQKLKETSL